MGGVLQQKVGSLVPILVFVFFYILSSYVFLLDFFKITSKSLYLNNWELVAMMDMLGKFYLLFTKTSKA